MTRRARPALAALLTTPMLLAPMLAPALVAPVGAVPAVGPGGAVPAARAAAEGPDCDTVGADTELGDPVTGENAASVELQVPQATEVARRRGVRPGAGVSVVVLDSGAAGYAARPSASLASSHGVLVAGIVAGPDQPKPRIKAGIAPRARIVDLPFYAAPRHEASDGVPVPTAGALEQRLREVGDRLASGALGPRTIVLVPAEVPGSDRLRAALDRVVARGALVIAAAGDRPGEDESFLAQFVGKAKPGEDAAAEVWPAAHEDVVAVGVSTPGSLDTVLRSSAIDLAAPGTGSVVKGLNGAWCVVTSVSTHWAAAQVAGVAALVWSAHPKESAAWLRARLEATASGNGAATSPLTGFGVVQPVEALRREVEATDATGLDEEVAPGRVPRKRADVLAAVREDAVWWGLGGGAALVVLLVLRPVLARRR
ncbi:S8 family serine peptidase [Nocardioides sp. zg-ZUI104]|uniref:S8 family serine peptidase n=1 Tax=Nocardioides faecalis TaxID=2803858 RepID=UPI001BCDAC6D|nr:S8/S53 family peptidase [Nocardioides faecalis]MBS4752104.1 S8 family serine peptidase [Nocardioides faecalis]